MLKNKEKVRKFIFFIFIFLSSCHGKTFAVMRRALLCSDPFRTSPTAGRGSSTFLSQACNQAGENSTAFLVILHCNVLFELRYIQTLTNLL